jgi:hypothetical protein
MENNTISDNDQIKALVKQQLRRARITAIVLGVSCLMSMLFFVFSQVQRIETQKSYELVIHLQKELEAQKMLAEKNREICIRNETMAKASELNARKALEECQKRK